MKFTPLTDEELRVQSLLPEGMYNYIVVKAEDKISKAGNEYISMVLKVWDTDGKDHPVFTNLSLIKLLKHFCDVNLMEAQYQSGNIIAEELVNKSGGQVIIGIEPEKPDGKGGVYQSKNVVKDYVKELERSKLNPIKPENDLNDDLPF